MNDSHLHEMKKIKKTLTIVLFMLIVVFSVWYVEFNLFDFIHAVPTFFSFIFTDFFPPDVNNFQVYLRPVVDTILLAFIATGVSTVLGMVFAILIAQNTTPNRVIGHVLKAILTFFRNIPFLVWASVLVIIFGVGNLPGLLALIIFGTSFLARVYSESIEELDHHVVEAIEAVGGNYFHVIKHAIFPQFMPSFLNWTLYMVEIGIRASAILGLVGAGGLGTIIKQTMDLFQYSKTSMAIVIMIVIIIFVESVSQKLRERII
ncbi:phosphonate ABC transporter, permease protein PhnE [Bacillus sp. FJAT-42315]|uniref:phosphonate ABC transporter, permease protein PhnE n=1 Tax=Bacillus sp. FJAT-42315 TaxID=2014077 RepID=UPI000C24965B|nr:phosphonate ABC transporter, permease protein PhnE [Bacillus sp. FJAT-42315]